MAARGFREEKAMICLRFSHELLLKDAYAKARRWDMNFVSQLKLNTVIERAKILLALSV